MTVQAESAVFDGTNLEQSAGGQIRLFLRIVSGLYDGLQVRGTDDTIPSAEGQVPRARVGHQRIIELDGWCSGTGANETAQRGDMVDLLDELAALFNPRKMPQTLSATRMDGSVVEIEARPMDDLHIVDTQGIPTYRSVSVSLLSVSPDWSAAGS